MGVKEDIRWLKEAEERVDLFAHISKRGPLKVRNLKEFLNSDDWWQIKYHVKDLDERGLIEEKNEEGFKITEDGEKVFESLKTVYDIESI
jgi:predicted transcriptional regulator